MSNYLSHLAARALGRQEPVRPRLPSLFEPPTGARATLPFEAADAAPTFFEREADAPATIQAPVTRRAAPRDAHPSATDAAALTPAPLTPPAAPRPREAWRERPEGAPAAPAWPRERAAGAESTMPRFAEQATETAAPPRRARMETPAPVEVVRRAERQAEEASERARAAEVTGEAKETSRALARRLAALEATRVDEQGRRESRETADDPFLRPAPPPAPPLASPRAVAPPPARGSARGDAPPQVHVTIGRVDVRAVFPAPAAAPAPPSPRPATQTLAEYLKQRERGRR